MNKSTSNEIISTLREIIKNPVCELNYSNPFELLCAVMLSAQTTDKRVNIVTLSLFDKYKTPLSLMNASYDDVYEIIKPVGLAKNKANNLINLARAIHTNYNDLVPNTLCELIKLPGVGRKTASVVLAVGFNIPAMPVDTHLHRMAIRFGYVRIGASVLEAEEAYKKYIDKEDWIEAHHLFLLFGRYYCKALNPICDGCKLKSKCKYKK